MTRVPSCGQVGPIQIKTFLCFVFFAFRNAASPLLCYAWLSQAMPSPCSGRPNPAVRCNAFAKLCFGLRCHAFALRWAGLSIFALPCSCQVMPGLALRSIGLPCLRWALHRLATLSIASAGLCETKPHAASPLQCYTAMCHAPPLLCKSLLRFAGPLRCCAYRFAQLSLCVAELSNAFAGPSSQFLALFCLCLAVHWCGLLCLCLA